MENTNLVLVTRQDLKRYQDKAKERVLKYLGSNFKSRQVSKIMGNDFASHRLAKVLNDAIVQAYEAQSALGPVYQIHMDNHLETLMKTFIDANNYFANKKVG